MRRPRAPRLSVVMPVRNGGAHLDDCVAALSAADYPHLEFCVLDDGSTDDTRERLLAWARRDGRVTLRRREDSGGVAAALNALAGLASGDVLVRQDADDVSLPRRFGVVAESHARHRWRLFHSRAFVLGDGPGCRFATYRLLPLARAMRGGRNPVVHGTVAMDRAMFLASGGYRACGHAEDLELFLRLLGRGERFRFHPEPLYYCRIHDGSTSAAHMAAQIDAARRIAGRPPATPRDVARAARHRRALFGRGLAPADLREDPADVLRIAARAALMRLAYLRHRRHDTLSAAPRAPTPGRPGLGGPALLAGAAEPR